MIRAGRGTSKTVELVVVCIAYTVFGATAGRLMAAAWL